MLADSQDPVEGLQKTLRYDWHRQDRNPSHNVHT